MQQFIKKFKDQILGALSGFDRLVLRGSLRRLQYGTWNGALQARIAKGWRVSVATRFCSAPGLNGRSTDQAGV